jgi:hypothetical protein
MIRAGFRITFRTGRQRKAFDGQRNCEAVPVRAARAALAKSPKQRHVPLTGGHLENVG